MTYLCTHVWLCGWSLTYVCLYVQYDVCILVYACVYAYMYIRVYVMCISQYLLPICIDMHQTYHWNKSAVMTHNQLRNWGPGFQGSRFRCIHVVCMPSLPTLHDVHSNENHSHQQISRREIDSTWAHNNSRPLLKFAWRIGKDVLETGLKCDTKNVLR